MFIAVEHYSMVVMLVTGMTMTFRRIVRGDWLLSFKKEENPLTR